MNNQRGRSTLIQKLMRDTLNQTTPTPLIHAFDSNLSDPIGASPKREIYAKY
jgi:hypothetical protein